MRWEREPERNRALFGAVLAGNLVREDVLAVVRLEDGVGRHHLMIGGGR